MSSGQTLGVKAQRFRGHTSPHRNVKEKKKLKYQPNSNQILKLEINQVVILQVLGSMFMKSEGNKESKKEEVCCKLDWGSLITPIKIGAIAALVLNLSLVILQGFSLSYIIIYNVRVAILIGYAYYLQTINRNFITQGKDEYPVLGVVLMIVSQFGHALIPYSALLASSTIIIQIILSTSFCVLSLLGTGWIHATVSKQGSPTEAALVTFLEGVVLIGLFLLLQHLFDII
eukprot:TRINITY_DN1502_c0_g1_i1.p1 TRINITY_DN1502_c0_g1~~TRINITY_DN1502_c0_g1_i1.p1  ORF type:complete len:240 (+),score=22.88 TRINITY_DN1502_c0_g1_i1:32-721(+)